MPFYSRYQRNQEKDGETKKCDLDPDFGGLCWILSKGHSGNYSGMTMLDMASYMSGYSPAKP